MTNQNFLGYSDSYMLAHFLFKGAHLIKQLGEISERFRPFHPQVAKLLEAIEEEQANDYLKLKEIYQDKFGAIS